MSGANVDSPALSKVEHVKAGSDHLRGTIAEELSQDTPFFGDDSIQLLKFHGMYQQDDRDKRKEARAAGLAKHWQMMIRTSVPGGRVTPDAYLAHDDIAQRWGNGTLRITTRQAFQLHGVLKKDIKASIQEINRALMTTLGGCGDQVRNIMTCPSPEGDRLRAEVQETLPTLVTELRAKTGAYHEIWLDGERVEGEEEEPVYGDSYLPRKFKIAIAIEGDNCVDVYSDDLGLVAMAGPEGELIGFDVLVGGGLGRTNNKPDTYPAVGRPLAFVTTDQVLALSKAVIGVQRDNGNRADRRHARMKYLIAERGLDWFKEQVQARLDFPLQDPRPLRWNHVDDHLGWHRQPGRRWFYGLYVENGRIQDEGDLRLRSAVRRIVEVLRPTLYLTAQQNLIFADLTQRARRLLPEILAEHGVTATEDQPRALRHSMACPAIPTCGLAVAEAERGLPSVVRELHGELTELGLQDERISVRMTGCPNGCARPYLGDVGFVGTTLGKYDVFLGGDFEGTRLNRLYAHNVPLDELVALLRPLLVAFARERREGEGFGDWCHEVGVDNLQERFQAGAA